MTQLDPTEDRFRHEIIMTEDGERRIKITNIVNGRQVTEPIAHFTREEIDRVKARNIGKLWRLGD